MPPAGTRELGGALKRGGSATESTAGREPEPPQAGAREHRDMAGKPPRHGGPAPGNTDRFAAAAADCPLSVLTPAGAALQLRLGLGSQVLRMRE
jgi:hypothetical protein